MSTCGICGSPVKRGRVYCSLVCSGKAVGLHPKRTLSLAERFERYVVRGVSEDDCWGWRGCLSQYGYGRLNLGGRGAGVDMAHRVAWRLFRGSLPDGMHVLHICDNPICSNPRHLYLGTQRENLRDAVVRRRGRYQRTTALTDEQCAEIRRLYDAGVPPKKIAVQLGTPYRLTETVARRDRRAPLAA